MELVSLTNVTVCQQYGATAACTMGTDVTVVLSSLNVDIGTERNQL